MGAGSLTINGKLLRFTCFQPGLDREYEYRRDWPKGLHFEAIDTQGNLVRSRVGSFENGVSEFEEAESPRTWRETGDELTGTRTSSDADDRAEAGRFDAR
jgi:hypothetical protein